MEIDTLKYWEPDGFEISSYRFNISSRVNKTYHSCGSDSSGKCIYTYNEIGFRGDSIKKDGFKIMSIGCSLTEGVGVSDDQTWSHFFSQKIYEGVDLNFGVSGRSNDYISRCLISYYDLIKPDLVLIMYTSPQRREIYTEEAGIEPFMPTNSWGWLKETEEGRESQKNLAKLQNKNSDFVNWYKNHLLIRYFLESKKCPWIWNGDFHIPKEHQEFNRFDGDYLNYLDFGADGNHPGPVHNEKYSEKLLSHIEKNFPDYIKNRIIQINR